MALDKAGLFTLINDNLPDNTSAEISPEDVRQVATQNADSALNTQESSAQSVSGEVDFTGGLKKGGVDVITDAPSDDGIYHRRNGEWVQTASFVGTTNASAPVAINTDAANPSHLPIDVLNSASGVVLDDIATGSIKNVTGRQIKTMSGNISFNPSVTGGTLKRIVLVSERSADNVTWVGNLNSIRKVEVGASSESFKTTVSFVVDWQPDGYLRFRGYEEASTGITLVTEAGTILGQDFTGPAIVWDLKE